MKTTPLRRVGGELWNMCFLILFSFQEVRPFSAIVRQMGLPEEKPVNIVLFSALHRFPAVFNAQPVYSGISMQPFISISFRIFIASVYYHYIIRIIYIVGRSECEMK